MVTTQRFDQYASEKDDREHSSILIEMLSWCHCKQSLLIILFLRPPCVSTQSSASMTNLCTLFDEMLAYRIFKPCASPTRISSSVARTYCCKQYIWFKYTCNSSRLKYNPYPRSGPSSIPSKLILDQKTRPYARKACLHGACT